MPSVLIIDDDEMMTRMIETKLQEAGFTTHVALDGFIGENLFWMGRYAERADHTARLAQAALTLLTDDGAPAPAVAQALGRLCMAFTGSQAESEELVQETLLRALTQSDVHVEDKMFATLDPVSRRLRFPRAMRSQSPAVPVCWRR